MKYPIRAAMLAAFAVLVLGTVIPLAGCFTAATGDFYGADGTAAHVEYLSTKDHENPHFNVTKDANGLAVEVGSDKSSGITIEEAARLADALR